MPDILANADGVIVSYLKPVQNRQRNGWPCERAFKELEASLLRALKCVCARADDERFAFRDAAYLIGLERVRAEMQPRGR